MGPEAVSGFPMAGPMVWGCTHLHPTTPTGAPPHPSPMPLLPHTLACTTLPLHLPLCAAVQFLCLAFYQKEMALYVRHNLDRWGSGYRVLGGLQTGVARGLPAQRFEPLLPPLLPPSPPVLPAPSSTPPPAGMFWTSAWMPTCTRSSRWGGLRLKAGIPPPAECVPMRLPPPPPCRSCGARRRPPRPTSCRCTAPSCRWGGQCDSFRFACSQWGWGAEAGMPHPLSGYTAPSCRWGSVRLCVPVSFY